MIAREIAGIIVILMLLLAGIVAANQLHGACTSALSPLGEILSGQR